MPNILSLLLALLFLGVLAYLAQAKLRGNVQLAAYVILLIAAAVLVYYMLPLGRLDGYG